MITIPTVSVVVLNKIDKLNKKRDVKGTLINIGDTVSFHNINLKTGEIEYLYGKVTEFVDENKAKVRVNIRTKDGSYMIKPCKNCRVEDR